MIRINILLVLFSCKALIGQQKQDSCFNSIFDDKPFLSLDSALLVKYNISSIKIYEAISDDTLPFKTERGEWKIEIKEGKVSCKWKDKRISTYYGQCYIVYKREKNKTKITEFIIYSGGEVKSTHFMNKLGRVYLTKREVMKGGQYEDNHFQYDKIEYRYSGDFLIVAEYTSTGGITEGYNPFLRIYYEYSK